MLRYHEFIGTAMKTALKAIISFGTVAGVALVVAQNRAQMAPMTEGAMPKPTIGSDTLKFKTTLGSFKILGSSKDPARGNLNVSFRGTILLTDAQGDVKITGDVRKEYEDIPHKKVAYFGKGHLALNGSARSVQFFGSDVDGSFKGFGVMRMYGEFDKNFDTGTYQFVGSQPMPWGTGGINLPVPQVIYGQMPNVKPKVQDSN
ncbi:hypothetical protein BH11ARM2_BH11ARM2_30200 [soil metagenome]